MTVAFTNLVKFKLFKVIPLFYQIPPGSSFEFNYHLIFFSSNVQT
jgi:hypothetical protein